MSVLMMQKRCCCCQPITCSECFSGEWPPPLHYGSRNGISYPTVGRVIANLRCQHEWTGHSPWEADDRVGDWVYSIQIITENQMPFVPSTEMSWQSSWVYVPFTATYGIFLYMWASLNGVIVYRNDDFTYPKIGYYNYPLVLRLECSEDGWAMSHVNAYNYNLHVSSFLCVDSHSAEGNPRMTNYKSIVCNIWDYDQDKLVPYNTFNTFSIAWYGEY